MDDTLRPLEYPTVVRELTEAAVLRIEEGLDGTLAFLLGITSDDANDDTRGFGGGATRGAAVGWDPLSAAAASRARRVDTLRVCRAVDVGLFGGMAFG